MTAIQPQLTLSPTGPWTSSQVSGATDGANLYFCITALASGQSAQLRIIAYDAFGNAYYYGPARVALSATGQYLYCLKPGNGTTGGAIPSDGVIDLPVPETYAIELIFGDTGGTKEITFSLAAGGKA